MEIKFLGATGTVTGSRYLVNAHGKQILVDCGLFQGLKALRLRNREPFPIDPRQIDAVVLTHAHLDHTGYLPLLIRDGFRGPVYCTPATRDLCAILLPDSGHLQEEEAERANRYGYSRHHPALPLYTQLDAEAALDQFVPVPFEEMVTLGEELSFRFHPSGHLLGAAMVSLHNASLHVLFSGDLGRSVDPLLPAPARVDSADYLVLESTYGNRWHDAANPLDQLEAVIQQTARRGGSILIPAFAVGRTQHLLYLIHRLKAEKRIPDLPVFLDSPMAQKATALFRDYSADLLLAAEECEEVCAEAEAVESIQESRALDRMRYPRIIISASGMATGGRVLGHLQTLAPDSRNTVLFCGFQAAGTRGADMVAGASSVKIYGEQVPIRARVIALDSLSAHADQAEILHWLAGFRRPPRTTFITHGEPAAAEALRKRIEKGLQWQVRVPEYLEAVDLRPATARTATMAV